MKKALLLVIFIALPVGAQTLCPSSGKLRCVDTANTSGWQGNTFEQWMNAALSAVGQFGTVWVLPGTYTASTGGITTTAIDQAMVCLGPQRGCIINFDPASPATLFTLTTGTTAVAYGDSIIGFSIAGSGSAQKIGIKMVDTSGAIVQNVLMAGMNGNSSIGIWVKGRELGLLDRINITADLPLEIDLDPNVTSENFDAWTVRDLLLTPSSTQTGILIQPGTIMFHSRFRGIDCVGGSECILWDETGAVPAVSYNNTFENLHHEGATPGRTYSFDFIRSDPEAQVQQDLEIVSAQAAPEINGIRLQRAFSPVIITPLYGGSGTALNIDGTNMNCSIIGSLFVYGSTVVNNCYSFPEQDIIE